MAFNVLHRTRKRPLNPGIFAGIAQHIDNLLGRIVTKQLAVFALVISDAPFLHHYNEIEL